MDDRTALLTNVLYVPADDTARLILADWLEEHDEEEFGRFLRAGVVASQFRKETIIEDLDYFDAVKTIADITTSGKPAGWLSALGLGPSSLTDSDWLWDNAGDRVTVRIGTVVGVFTRGMLSEVQLPLERWYECAQQALTSWPLEMAIISDLPGLSFWIESPDNNHPAWSLSAAITIQPRRRDANMIRLGALFGLEGGPRPIAVRRWTAERTFVDREALVRLARYVWPVLLDEVRDAAGAAWEAMPRRG